jgi:hypothetical protein
MILQNPYSQAGNAIRLGGDLRRAASYKKYAWSKLNQLKTMMYMSGSNMIKKYYSVEGGCVDIIVQSVAGMDSIYINACSGGGCKVVLSLSGDTVPARNAKINIKHSGMDNDGGFNGIGSVGWGDGIASFVGNAPNDTELNRTHQYATSGTYTITYTGMARKFFKSTGSMTAPSKTLTHYKREITNQVNASTAHSVCTALPWSVDTGIGLNDKACRHGIFGSGSNWDCIQGYDETIIDLTGEEGGKIWAHVTATQGLASTDPDVHAMGTVNDVKVANVGIFSSTLLGTVEQNWSAGILPVGGMVSVKETDNSIWAFPSISLGLGEFKPFFHPAVNTSVTFYAFGCKVLKTLEVTV